MAEAAQQKDAVVEVCGVAVGVLHLAAPQLGLLDLPLVGVEIEQREFLGRRAHRRMIGRQLPRPGRRRSVRHREHPPAPRDPGERIAEDLDPRKVRLPRVQEARDHEVELAPRQAPDGVRCTEVDLAPPRASFRGGAGDDILIAGNAGVGLSGGDGADLFVIGAAQGTIIIRDFEKGRRVPTYNNLRGIKLALEEGGVEVGAENSRVAFKKER